jgi:hypothetical protein
MLPREHQQELLSLAYVRAVAARAGVVCVRFDSDYGVDLSVRGVTESDAGFIDGGDQIDLQIKSTTRASVKDKGISYDLNVRNYNHLRESNPNVHRILVVFILPENDDLWLTQSADELILRHCAYWLSLEGHPATKSKNTVRITIPKGNIFSVAAVTAMMQERQEGSQS